MVLKYSDRLTELALLGIVEGGSVEYRDEQREQSARPHGGAARARFGAARRALAGQPPPIGSIDQGCAAHALRHRSHHRAKPRYTITVMLV